MCQAWECRSRIARNLIARRCLLAFQVGLLRFLSLAWLCLLALLGLAARDGSLQRCAHSSRCQLHAAGISGTQLRNTCIQFCSR